MGNQKQMEAFKSIFLFQPLQGKVDRFVTREINQCSSTPKKSRLEGGKTAAKTGMYHSREKTKALGEIWTLDPWFTRPVL